MNRVLAVLAMLLVCVSAGQNTGRDAATTASPFIYVRHVPADFVDRVEMERAVLARAAEAAEAEAWGLGLALLLEYSRSADGAIARAMALDAVLDELVRARAFGLLASLSPERKAGLARTLADFDPEDPAGVRGLVRERTRQRLAAIRSRVLEAAEPTGPLDDLLRTHGWTATGGVGPQGRQRAQDRADFRSLQRGEVAGVIGLDRWHMMLPPTEALAGARHEDLEYRHRRSSGLANRLDLSWAHPDLPRLDDFVLDIALRDNTGITRLVHGDSYILAQHDRMRRWRMREALWRLGYVP